MLIALDFGHSKKADDGAYGILEEFKVNREYGALVKKYLEQLGHTVDIVSKDTCTSQSDALIYRTKMEHKKKYDLYISCHANCYNGNGQGCEVLYISNTGKVYAEKIVNEIASLGFKNRGAKYRDNLYVLKHTYSSAIIIEPFFVDNKHDCNLYNADKIARAIVKGITGTNVKGQIAFPQKNNKKYTVDYCLEFQKWFNKVTQTGVPLVVDGICGARTEKALEIMSELVHKTSL